MQSLKQIAKCCCIVMCLFLPSAQYLWAQTPSWRTFERNVFHMADDITHGQHIGHENIDRLVNTLSAFMRQGQCPTPQVCQAMKYIILTIRQVASGSSDNRQQIAFLRQAVHNYDSPAQQQAELQQASLTQIAHIQQVAINYVYRPAGAQEFRPLENGGVMHSGDSYKIIFTPQEDIFVYIFQVDSSGMIYALYPMESFRGVRINLTNPVRAGRDYFLPAHDKSFQLDSQTGQERFFFLTSRTQDHALERDFQHLVRIQNEGEQSPPQTPKREEMLTAQAKFTRTITSKGPAVIVSDNTEPASASWQEDGTDFSVLRQRLAGACDSCINVLTFMHE